MLRKAIFILSIFLLNACAGNHVQPFSHWTEPITGMEFVLIPGGGSLESEDFWLASTEVTQEQWFRIMGNKELHPEKPSPFRNINKQYPIVSISYFDSQLYLEKLNKLSGKYHFRLPTEAEWEYACRAGTTTPFSYGEHISDSLVNFGNNVGHPMPVGSYPPNPWGLFDMHGNVWEWVSDWYTPKSKEKVIRGGSWYFGADNAKSSSRRSHEPGLWGFSIGFRIVCEKK